jgi:hypothetical protein
MRWIIERLFSRDEVREDKNFARFFTLELSPEHQYGKGRPQGDHRSNMKETPT